MKTSEEINLAKRSKTMRSQIIKLNNGYLNKVKKTLENGKVMLPYLIDATLVRKKKQPTFVLDGSVN